MFNQEALRERCSVSRRLTHVNFSVIIIAQKILKMNALVDKCSGLSIFNYRVSIFSSEKSHHYALGAKILKDTKLLRLRELIQNAKPTLVWYKYPARCFKSEFLRWWKINFSAPLRVQERFRR